MNRVRIGAVVAVVVVVAFVAWLIFRDGGDDNNTPQGPSSSAASVAQLRSISDETGQPVYWAGPRLDYTYELTRTTDGNVYIRYLPPGTAVGAQEPNYLTVGTYPRRRAERGLKRIARRQGSVSFTIPDSGFAVYSRARPNSVYIAYPGEDVQVEIYDPNATRARRLARSGRVRPIT
jgi:hypothetical protein